MSNEYFEDNEYNAQDLVNTVTGLEELISSSYSDEWIIRTNGSLEKVLFNRQGYDLYKESKKSIEIAQKYNTTSSGAINIDTEAPIFVEQSKLDDSNIVLKLK